MRYLKNESSILTKENLVEILGDSLKPSTFFEICVKIDQLYLMTNIMGSMQDLRKKNDG